MLAAGEMLHMAELYLLLERNLRPMVTVRGLHQAVHDAVKIKDAMVFAIDTQNRKQVLKILNSCIGTKYTVRFGGDVMIQFWEIFGA